MQKIRFDAKKWLYLFDIEAKFITFLNIDLSMAEIRHKSRYTIFFLLRNFQIIKLKGMKNILQIH